MPYTHTDTYTHFVFSFVYCAENQGTVRKAAVWCNSLLLKFENNMPYCFRFMVESPIQRFHNVWVSIRRQCRGLMSPMVIKKIWQLGSHILIVRIKEITPEFLGDIQAMTDNHPSRSIRSIARESLSLSS